MNASLANGSGCDYESEQSEFDVAYRFYVNGLLLNVVAALGIVGNALSMAVLSRPQMRSSINYLLVGLARSDTVLCLTSILLFGLPGVHPYTGLLKDYYYKIFPHLVLVAYPLALIAQTLSVYLTLTVTAERFVAVCHPLRARSLCTYGRARAYTLVVLVLAFVYNLPKFWETEVASNEVFLDDGGVDVIYCVQPSAFRTPLYVAVYIHWMYLVFMYIVPFGGLAVLNALIYRRVRLANAERARLSRLQRREIGLATMLLVVVLVFFFCNLLPLVTNTLECFGRGPMDTLVKTSNLLVTINSSVNFVVYVTFGDKFKRLFVQMFCSRGPLAPGARDSPELATRDDSLLSHNGERHSMRLQRHNTKRPDPAPVVYYPTTTTITNVSDATQF